ncbi:ABC transporter permease [Salipiger bermudensis]|uniref:ABC transporter permease n=1 Tax=Salipiger bermudensis TaxID=344736 RepID=UPI001CD2ECCA|nr:ABC transporter permease [Salipiger bermudensis]MCA1283950.1 ABC transporter permease [Salipiger bermudensis]
MLRLPHSLLPWFLVIQRLGIALLTLIIVSFAVFFATELLPGDVAEILLGQAATPEAVAGLRAAMGLDEPALSRFIGWLAGLASGDLGTSYVNKMEIVELLSGRLRNSLQLAGVTTLVSVPIALSLGIGAAMWRGSLFDRVVTVLTISVISVPEFMVATLAVLIFAVWLDWLPALSYGADMSSLGTMLKAYAMPVITLSFVVSAQMIRMTRAAVIETINTPYVEMALLKGASRKRMVLVHALPNALGPIANAVALSLSYLVGGVIIVETIFNYPGVAKLMVDAVSTRDLPLIQSCAMIFCVSYLMLITLADLIAILSNPRLRR